MAATLVLSTRRELSLFQLTPGSAAPLILQASAPLSTPVRSLSWNSSATKFLAVAEHSLSVWSRDGTLLREVDRTDDDAHLPISSGSFLGRDLIIFASGSSAYVYPPTGEPTAFASPANPTSLALNADESLLALSAGPSLVVHSLAGGGLTTLHARPKAAYTTLRFHPTRRAFLAAGTTAGVVHLFDTTKPSAPLKSVSLSSGPSPAPISSLVFQLVLGHLVAADEKGTVALVDTKQCKIVASVESGTEIEQGAMTLASDGRTVVLAGRGCVRLLDLKLRSKVVEFKVGDGRDKVLSVSLEPLRPRSDRAVSPTKTAVASTLLLESVNRLRQSKLAHERLENGPDPRAARLAAMKVAFPSVQLLPSTPIKIDDDLPPSKRAFAESILREARTSTMRTSVPPPALSPMPRSPPRTSSPSSVTSPSARFPSTAPIRNSPLTDKRLSASHNPPRSTEPVRLGRTFSHPTTRATEADCGFEERRHRRQPSTTRPQSPVYEERREKASSEVEVARRPVSFFEDAEPPPTSRRPTSLEIHPETPPPAHHSRKSAKSDVVAPPADADSLKSLIRDVVEESRQDIKDLHVEMLRQTFAQKEDTRSLLVDFLGGELERLREENARLKAENDRLRNR